MNEVMQIRAASWAAMIKQRNDSGLTIREWCAANGIQESVYYYRLNRLRKMALDVEETPAPASQNVPAPERFAQLPVSSTADSTVAIRIRRGDREYPKDCVNLQTDVSKQRCTRAPPLFPERGDVPCCLRLPVFRPSISIVENVISAKGLMV